ncbi:MAG: aminoacyl-tRNA hydrolase [Deltaproteobacteria bacterium]|nr:MAG: aminoacyl-tRNA hydrolase [Deltaproteobacteria bacterium]RKX58553.1 MAG: aminoacyl-tRNA hydrolase [Thermodesulfobacteriota bacterium]
MLLAGLGNPGLKYRNSRHNVGFAALDSLASQFGLDFILHKKFPLYESVSGSIAGIPVILLKPLTYMNRSGEVVASVLDFYKIPRDRLIVVHDDLDLSLGRLKFAQGGGSGGHKGVESIIGSVGSKEFPRLKIGIGRPGSPVPIDRYVLSPFMPEEVPIIDKILGIGTKGLVCFLEKGIEAAMNEFNGLKIEAGSAKDP